MGLSFSRLYLFVLRFKNQKTHTARAGAILHVTYGWCREIDGEGAYKRNNDLSPSNTQITPGLHLQWEPNGHKAVKRRAYDNEYREVSAFSQLNTVDSKM